MRVRHGLDPAEPLLVGRLYVNRTFGGRERPCLGIEVWCPYCKRTHVHGWTAEPPFRSNVVEHRVSHCGPGPFDGRGYHIGLDPAARGQNDAAVREYLDAVLAWEGRQARLARAIPGD